MSKPIRFLLLFVFLFFFRLFFGLLAAKWQLPDEFHTYLIGLKCYTTGTWPYFGPDLNGSESAFQSQIPGALEGFLIGLPFRLLPIPEAPFILLNLMTTSAVLLLAWYIHKRLPEFSWETLGLWIAVAPWSLHEGTHIITPPYNFLPSVLFFIGFMETLPWLRLGLFSYSWSNAFMGFSIFWIMQFHFSYVYLIPLAFFSLLLQMKTSRQLSCWVYFALGSLPTLALVVPTYLKYGLVHSNVASGLAVPFNVENFLKFVTILARFLSLACFELPRFIGFHTVDRVDFLKSNLWIFIPGVFLWMAGWVQAVTLLFGWFQTKSTHPDWNPLKWIFLGAFAMVYASFWFTIKQPLSHIYFVFFPFIMTYSCYCWARFADRRPWRFAAKLFLALALFFQIGYAVAVAPQDSLYTQRALVAKAIQEKNYHILGERRPGSFY